MAYSTINKSTEHFKTKLYTGNGSTQHSITGVGFQPDWTWIKSRDDTYSHFLFDSVRGVGKQIYSNSANAQGTNLNNLYSFDSDGFSLAQSGNDDVTNKNNSNFVSWNWKAGGTGVSNTDGTLTSTVSVNSTAGFSIVEYTGNGTSGATVGHGLGKKPSLIILKSYENGQQWTSYWSGLGATKYQRFNATNVAGTSSARWNNTEPTTSVFTIGNDGEVNTNGQKHIAYCFANIQGYSRSGVYNGGTNTFVYTGFKPRFILGKESSTSSGYNWHLFVPEILGRNETSNAIAEYTDYLRVVDWNSNGFRWATSLNNWDNSDGRQYVWVAFGQTMVGTNDIPCTAGSTDG